MRAHPHKSKPRKSCSTRCAEIPTPSHLAMCQGGGWLLPDCSKIADYRSPLSGSTSLSGLAGCGNLARACIVEGSPTPISRSCSRKSGQNSGGFPCSRMTKSRELCWIRIRIIVFHLEQILAATPARACSGQRKGCPRISFHLEQKIAVASAAWVAGMAWGTDCVDEMQNDALRSKLRALGKILDRAQVGKDAAGRWMQRLAVTGADLKTCRAALALPTIRCHAVPHRTL